MISNIQLAIFNFLICVDSKSVVYVLQNWACKMRRDLVYEGKHLIYCIVSRSIRIEFCWIPSHCGFYWNELSDELAKQGAVKKIVISYNNLLLSSHKFASILENTLYKEFEGRKSKYVIPSDLFTC